MNIFDTDNQQFTIPSDVIPVAPGEDDASLKTDSDLEFHYESNPFSFWITRRSEPDGQPLFDTRPQSLPPTPIPPVITTDNSTALDGFPLVFEDQYLQLTSALPLGANVYGLGETLASFGFRRDVGTDGGVGTIQTLWARDIGDPLDQNVYVVSSCHTSTSLTGCGLQIWISPHLLGTSFQRDDKAFAVTRRLPFRVLSFSNSRWGAFAHGLLLFLSAAGSDILLLTPPSSPVSLVQYRLLGGTLDFYFFSGPSPQNVVEQYGALIGLPTWQPAWGFGFHLCRWGYSDVNDTRTQVEKMREANIPLETMWNDIDLYHALRDFTTDPVSFPADEVAAFIADLVSACPHLVLVVFSC